MAHLHHLPSSTTSLARDESKMSAFSAQLKKLYCDISALETKILTNSGEPQDESRIVIKGGPSVGVEEAEMVWWKKAVET